MKIKPLIPGKGRNVGVYIATTDNGLRTVGRIARRPQDDAKSPWCAEKQSLIGRSQSRFRTLNEARAWVKG